MHAPARSLCTCTPRLCLLYPKKALRARRVNRSHFQERKYPLATGGMIIAMTVYDDIFYAVHNLFTAGVLGAPARNLIIYSLRKWRHVPDITDLQ